VPRETLDAVLKLANETKLRLEYRQHNHELWERLDEFVKTIKQ
jgi:hypothetical protein